MKRVSAVVNRIAAALHRAGVLKSDPEAVARYNAVPGLLGIVRFAMEQAEADDSPQFARYARDLLAAMERELAEKREEAIAA